MLRFAAYVLTIVPLWHVVYADESFSPLPANSCAETAAKKR